MQVELQLFATLRKYAPDQPLKKGLVINVEPPLTVSMLLEKAGVPLDKVKIIMVNNRHAGFDRELAAGDRVAVFPPVAGG